MVDLAILIWANDSDTAPLITAESMWYKFVNGSGRFKVPPCTVLNWKAACFKQDSKSVQVGLKSKIPVKCPDTVKRAPFKTGIICATRCKFNRSKSTSNPIWRLIRLNCASAVILVNSCFNFSKALILMAWLKPACRSMAIFTRRKLNRCFFSRLSINTRAFSNDNVSKDIKCRIILRIVKGPCSPNITPRTSGSWCSISCESPYRRICPPLSNSKRKNARSIFILFGI